MKSQSMEKRLADLLAAEEITPAGADDLLPADPAKPIVIELLMDGEVLATRHFKSRHLAWSYGENWKQLSPYNDYKFSRD